MPEPEKKKPATGTVAQEPLLWATMAETMGEGLTPRRISSVLRAADAGVVRPLHDAINEVRRKDGAVQSLLQTREKGLLACGWSIVAAETGAAKGSKEQLEADEIASFVRAAIMRVDVRVGEFSFGFGRALAHLLDAITKGFSVLEVDWEVVDGDIVPRRLRVIAGRRFGWDEKMRLCLIDPQGDGNQLWPGLPLSDFAYKFLVHAPRVNGDDQVREGLGRLILWYACFRIWSWRDLLVFAELFGKPWREFIFQKDLADSEDEQLAKDMARFATSTTAVAHPDSIECKISWPEAKGGAQSSPSPTILQRAEDDLAIAIIGQKATTGSVQSGLGGSGDVRDLVREDIRDGDEQALCETVGRQLFGPMVWAKYGPDAAVPRLTFASGKAPDLDKLMSSLEKGVRLGVQIPVSYVHDVTGWPAAEGQEPVLQASAPVVALPPGGDDEPSKSKDDDKPKEKAKKDAA